MKQKMIVAMAAFLFLAVIPIIFWLHDSAKKEFLSQFQEHQILHAHHFAEQIESFLWGHSRGLQGFRPFGHSSQDVLKQAKDYIQMYSRGMEKTHIKQISLCDESGRIIYSTDMDAVESTLSDSECFSWAKREENRGKTYVSPVPPSRSGNSKPNPLKVILATPLYQDLVYDAKRTRPGGRFVGVLTLTVALKELLDNELKDSIATVNQFWLMQEDGTLLSHSGHPEMVNRNIFRRTESCTSCHVSFDHVKKILKQEKGTMDFQEGNYPRKLAALAPVRFENLSWVLVVNSPYDEVTALQNKSLRGHLMLLGIVVLAFSIGSVLLLRNDRLKVKAEEESKHWQERIAERRRAEEVLRESRERLQYLSSQLLTAQETERKRISRELHDELMQALTLMKLRLRVIQKGKDGTTVPQDCQDILEHIDQVIENVRRLSRDLSPSVLEDLGLSAALRWLSDNFVKGCNMKVKLDIIDIDHLFPEDAQIIIYRIIQEALTNIGKHAQAQNVSVVVERQDGQVSFSVEDDGKGFDVKKAVTRGFPEKGLGLTTMDERARMLGVAIDLWSEEGKGTRITFSVPIMKDES